MKLRKRLLCGILALLPIAAGCAKKRQSQVEADLTRPAEKWLEMEPVELLRDYVRIDTTTLGPGEEEGARFLQRLLDCPRIETEIVCPAPRRCNLLARLPGRQREGALLLLNHIDVAPARAADWRDAFPFSGTIKGGYMYGRGTYDMKSLAIAQALALRSLSLAGIVPRFDVLFLAEADEEVEQKWGSRWLLEHRPEWFKGVSAILNEGATIEVVLRDARFWGVETVQAGYATAEFASPSADSIASLARKWAKLDAGTVEPHPHVRMGFDMLANHLTSPLTDPLRHLDRVRRDPKELALLPDRYASFLQSRIFWAGPVPDPEAPKSSIGLVVISTPPGIDPTGYLEAVLADARKAGVRVTSHFSGGRTTASPYPTPFTDILKRVIEAHYPGVPFGPVPTFSAYTTSVRFRNHGFPTYGYSTIPMNITDAIRRHGNNERIYLRDYLTGVAAYRDLLEEFALTPGL